VEEALAAIWSELLGVEKVGRHDNFFELGGHSLLAVRMIGRSADLGLTIRIESLFLAPVLSDLATLLEATATRSDQEIVLLRRTSDDRAVFFVPSGLGSYEYAVALAERMPTGPTLYAVPWPEVDFASHTIDALAGLAVTAIRRVQGSGPYHLAGYSSGGAFAYAIAEQLLAQGEAVAFLGLIDVDLPAKADRAFGDARDALIDTIKDHARRSGSEERRHLPDEADLRTVIAEAQDLGAIPSWLDGEKWTRAHQFDLALRSYDPPKLPLVIHQFYAAARAVPNAAAMGQARPFTRGWDAVVPAASIRVIDIPGDHFSIVSAPEGLAALGARVSEALEQAFR
jgi:thioesterase domain-containing protein